MGLPIDEIKEEYTKFEVVARDVSSEVKQQFFVDEVFMAKKTADGDIIVNRAPTSNAVVLLSSMKQIGLHAVDSTGISVLDLKTLPKTEGAENDIIRTWNGAVQSNWSAVTYTTKNKKYVTDGLTLFENYDSIFKNQNWKGLNPKVAGENEANWVGEDAKNSEGGVYIVMVAAADASGASSVKTMKFGVNYYASGDEYMSTGNGTVSTATPKAATKSSSKTNTSKTTKNSGSSSSSSGSSSKDSSEDTSNSPSGGSSSSSSGSSPISSTSDLQKLNVELSRNTNTNMTDAIEALQERLIYFGYSRLNVDGSFGAKTERAVIDFQRINGLSDDGIVGKNTIAALINSNSKGPRDNGYEGSYVTKTLSRSSTGKDVYALQRRLNELGYGTLSVDGDYGDNTQSAVESFRSSNGISKSGGVTDEVLEILNSEDAVSKGASNNTNSSTASSNNDKPKPTTQKYVYPEKIEKIIATSNNLGPMPGQKAITETKLTAVVKPSDTTDKSVDWKVETGANCVRTRVNSDGTLTVTYIENVYHPMTYQPYFVTIRATAKKNSKATNVIKLNAYYGPKK